MQILHLDSSIHSDQSVSRRLSATLVQALCARAHGATVVYRDLVAEPITHMDGATASLFRPTGVLEVDDGARREHERSEALLTELLASDVVVIGAPMYNFSIPTQLKAWIDRIVQPGRTFKFYPTGAVGLTSGTRVVIASSRGGVYSSGGAAALDFQERYLKAILDFIGIADVRIVRAEGTNGAYAERAIADALHEATSMSMCSPISTPETK